MKRKGEIIICGKTYKVEMICGVNYVEGKTIDEFMKTLDLNAIIDLYEVGVAALTDELRGTKPRKYKQMMKCSHLKRNN